MPKKVTIEDFIIKANIIHNNFYDYTLVNYINSITKVDIVCNIHGSFKQIPNSHLNGRGCPSCGIEYNTLNQTRKINDYITKANIKHNNFYDYSLVEYINSYTKIIIICPKHGQFTQSPNHHLNGRGCTQCGIEKNILNQSSSTECFINKAITLYGDKFDYSLVEYKTAHKKIKIVCPKHGVFEQIPNSHLNGKGCKKCSKQISKGEKEVLTYIKSLYSGVIQENDRIQIKPKELDIYLPDLNIAFEYNGEYWHKLHELKNPGCHQLKEDLCKDKNILLINISDNDWQKNKDKTKKLIQEILNA